MREPLSAPLLVLLVCGAALSASPRTPGPHSEAASDVSLREGRVVDREWGYSFDAPEGWILQDPIVPEDPAVKDPSKVSNLEISDPARTMRLMLRAEKAVNPLSQEFKALKLAQPLMGGWTRVREEWTRIAGAKAGLVEGVRTPTGRPARHEWNFVAIRRSRKYTLRLVAPQAEADAARERLEGILASFAWGGDPVR